MKENDCIRTQQRFVWNEEAFKLKIRMKNKRKNKSNVCKKRDSMMTMKIILKMKSFYFFLVSFESSCNQTLRNSRFTIWSSHILLVLAHTNIHSIIAIIYSKIRNLFNLKKKNKMNEIWSKKQCDSWNSPKQSSGDLRTIFRKARKQSRLSFQHLSVWQRRDRK